MGAPLLLLLKNDQAKLLQLFFIVDDSVAKGFRPLGKHLNYCLHLFPTFRHPSS